MRDDKFPKWRRFKRTFSSCLNRYSFWECWQWYFGHSKELSRFKNIHRGKECFIIGNGPSINQIDLSLLKKYHTFGLNKIFLIFDRIDLNLSYHVAVNPHVIQQSSKEIESLPCPSFLSFKSGHQTVRHLDHIYFLVTSDGFDFSDDLLRVIHEGRTVTYVAMQLAYFMGFSKVFLIGIDHSFKCKGQPNEKQKLDGEDPNHFDPRYFKNSHWQLPDLEGSELAYRVANFYFKRHGRQIFDATLNGNLTVFPKISYDKALQYCNPK